ncbi:hypothetical protein SETIT_9G209200v2 [Setaria italica]|uniref:Basic secretory protease n=1 Tax=Setaria italica TaxID=4555 RepID=K4AJW6_SETIT|nr:hypothetical protein SETIT_9G209200v2 [Setaria italica]
MKLHAVAIASLLAVAATAGAVTFDVKNEAASTPGGQRFDRNYGADYARQVLSDASTFTWSVFNQLNPADRRPADGDTVLLAVRDTGGIASTSGSTIELSARYDQVTGVLYHEVAHVWQWGLQDYGAHPGIFEGIADYVRLKAGYVPGHWVKPGQGDRWDQGYDVTARFLDYCDSLRPGFVAQLNAKLKDGYNEDYFVQILGKNVQQLWQDYKNKYRSG